MGGKGGGDSAPMIYQQQSDFVGHADPIDLTAKQEYINTQKAAADATAKTPTDTPTQGDDAKTPGGGDTSTGSTVANAVLAPPNYWFNQPISTLQAKPVSKSGSVQTTQDNVRSGST
ncbi:hypothetical protein QIH85_24080 [Bradyrhizobium japonicum]|uniref:hypothetical protein n=1 Tax=Bradyrhizobium japonicum TaxID=375 RepID=UPI0027144ADB|nr:hypothetical protein [Bradyrhizobium japonicum]WLB24963.1 hypothetical protein QIH85_24080 [Bradyrhizobium japonicum]